MRQMLKKWWLNHKTKSLGIGMVMLGAVQSQITQLQQYIPPKDFGLIIVALGVLVAVLGFLNSHQQGPPQ